MPGTPWKMHSQPTTTGSHRKRGDGDRANLPGVSLVSHFTTDGDSAAFRGIKRVVAECGQVVESFRDTYPSPRKKLTMPSSGRECFRDIQLPTKLNCPSKTFSVDFINKCTAEYDIAAKKFQGDTRKLVNTQFD